MKQKSANVSFEFSIYDLNMAKTLKEDLPFVLSTELVTNPRFEVEHFRSEVWRLVEMYCRDYGWDYDYLLKSPPGVPIIIDSTHYLYFHFLEIALIFYDPFLIKHFLTYQYNNFKGNQDAKNNEEFLGKLLFVGYTNVKLNSPNNNLHRKEKIFDWLEALGIENLPARLNKQTTIIEDTRYKGNLSMEEVKQHWLKLCSYEIAETKKEVMAEPDVIHFLHANFYGFNPVAPIRKINIKNIQQNKFRLFCREFFESHSPNAPTMPFIHILKNNFSIFDNTEIESLKKSFSRKPAG